MQSIRNKSLKTYSLISFTEYFLKTVYCECHCNFIALEDIEREIKSGRLVKSKQHSIGFRPHRDEGSQARSFVNSLYNTLIIATAFSIRIQVLRFGLASVPKSVFSRYHTCTTRFLHKITPSRNNFEVSFFSGRYLVSWPTLNK